MSSQKYYVSCGVQTDAYDLSSANQSLSLCERRTFQSPVGHSCVVTGSDVPSSESDITLANGSLVFESAYNQSPDSTSLLSPSYCVDHMTGILYSRPSEHRLSAKKRVLSLAGVPPTGKFKTTILGDKLRLVSMPERGKYASVSAKDSLLRKWCVDDLGDISNHEQTERPYPADLPYTPSPPSSPESITIIGNNAHVPGSFLPRPEYTDNDGWVSWANSPPRPIPALHGPLSLPYARCPSKRGAEGTLVEGDDLSHKIWGLGIDNSPMVHPFVTSRPSVRQAFRPQDYRPSQAPPTTAMSQDEFALSHYYERDTVIDLSRISQRVFSKQNIEHIVSALPISISRQQRMPQLADIESSETLLAKNIKFEEAYKARQSSTQDVGLGLHTWPQGSRLEDVGPICGFSFNPLNTDAPSFIPASANMKPYPTRQRYDASRSDKPLPYTFSAPRRPSEFNNAAESYRQPDAQSLLPTPPSTSSPCWTPIFSHQPEIPLSKSIFLTLNPKASKTDSYSPNVYPPISSLDDDFNRIIMQQTAIQETDIVDDSQVVPRTLNFQKDPFRFQAYPPKLDSLQVDVSSPLKATSSDIHDPLIAFSTNHENSLHDGSLLQAEHLQVGVGAQDSAERRRNLSYQPRSIPLARLIQRRLSSVAEGDLSTKILFPFLQEAQTGGFTRSKGLSLEPLGRQMPRIGLLETETFSVRTKTDPQLVYEAESMLNSDKSNFVVKLPPKANSLCHDTPSNREKKHLRYGKVTRQTPLNTEPTNSDLSKRHKIRVKQRSTATIRVDTSQSEFEESQALLASPVYVPN